ncbi:MAG: enoyl-CoA hydratase/isomerase family protein [Planctomycetes bacterium]|nr:enoyl-CoA hydratase/isomerase family protein [Planctomycetota bacterium]
MSEVVRVARADAIVEIMLNRPECRNAFSRALIAELTSALEQAGVDDAVRCIILTGAPPAFCAGLDLREVAQSTPEQVEQDAAAVLRLYETVDHLSKPVIAAVNGPAVAGGAGLVSVCDIAICAESVRIGYPEVKRGLVAAIVMTYLRRLVGERQAKFMLLTGELLTAEQALEIGLVNEVVPDGELSARARHYAEQLAGYPPQSLANTKILFNKVRSLQHADAVEEARRLNASMRLTSESRAGVSQFLKK